MQSEFIKRIALAQLIGVDPTTIDRWVNPKCKNHVPDFPKPIKIGRGIFFKRLEVEQFLNPH